jgi:uncharacterized protein (TIGR00296 family)
MATVDHCGYCFDSVLEHLDEKIEPPHFQQIFTTLNNNNRNHNSILASPSPSPDDSSGSNSSANSSPESFVASHLDKFPLFVTWKKRGGSGGSSKEWRLRGCIGTFSARELLRGLRDYAIHSAFKDSRFSPVTAAEIPFLSVDVSLLLHFEPANNYLDWTVGKHGIQIDFLDERNSMSYNATYLPDVAVEQGWNQEKTVEELIWKSGYRGNITNKLKQSIQLTRYQTSKASLTYTEYKERKQKLAKERGIVFTSTTATTTISTDNSSGSNSGFSIFTNLARKVLKTGPNNTPISSLTTNSSQIIKKQKVNKANLNNNLDESEEELDV